MNTDKSGKKNIPTYAYLVPIILLGLSMFAALVVSSRDGRSMMDQYVPLQDGIMTIKNDITLFRLSIEQHYFNKSEGKIIDWKRLEHAEFVANAMVKGGRDGENIYIPLKDPTFLRELALLDSKIDVAHKFAALMAGHEGDKTLLPKLDQSLDAALDDATKQAHQAEVALHEAITKRLSEYNLMTKGQMASCLVLTILAGVAIASYGRKQSQDITALTAAGDRLKKNEQELSSALGKVMLLSSAVEASPDVFQITDMAGDVMYSNKALMNVYGYSPDEFAGRQVGEMNADPGFTDSVILPSIRETGAWSGELTVKHRDGHIFPVWLTTSQIKDEAGEPVAMVGVVRDITERKRAEEELLKSKFILDNAGEEVYIIEPSGRYSYMNNTAMESLGYSPSEVPGLKVYDISQGLDEKTWLEHFNRHKTNMLATGNIPPFEVVHVRKDGKRIPKEVKPVYLEIGGKEYICSFVRDISERKNLEQYRSDFYAMITHDLKSPLTSILSCSYLLLDRARVADEDDVALLNTINRSGEKMVSLIDDFLSFEQVESGRLLPKLMFEDVSAILVDIGKNLDAITGKKGIDLRVEPETGLPPVLIDRKQAERAIRNLIGNAIAYTPRGGLVNVCSKAVSRAEGRFLEVSVSDTGPGIPKEEIGKIFNKYYRSPSAAGTKGSGLGLTIVKAVAEAHGGKVEVDSEPGKGSTFRLLFPMQS